MLQFHYIISAWTQDLNTLLFLASMQLFFSHMIDVTATNNHFVNIFCLINKPVPWRWRSTSPVWTLDPYYEKMLEKTFQDSTFMMFHVCFPPLLWSTTIHGDSLSTKTESNFWLLWDCVVESWVSDHSWFSLKCFLQWVGIHSWCWKKKKMFRVAEDVFFKLLIKNRERE